MHHHALELLRQALVNYGYVAVGVALLLENAGVPIPGETVLVLASFLAYSDQGLQLRWIILTGVVAATLGDNLGYYIGYRGGRPLLDRYRSTFHIRQVTVERGERIFERYGSVTVLFARFVFGMRVIAGPLAGVLRMRWLNFLLFNSLGAVLWVSAIACAGYLFGENWQALVHGMSEAGWMAVIVAVCIGIYFWWRSGQAAE